MKELHIIKCLGLLLWTSLFLLWAVEQRDHMQRKEIFFLLEIQGIPIWTTDSLWGFILLWHLQKWNDPWRMSDTWSGGMDRWWGGDNEKRSLLIFSSWSVELFLKNWQRLWQREKSSVCKVCRENFELSLDDFALFCSSFNFSPLEASGCSFVSFFLWICFF